MKILLVIIIIVIESLFLCAQENKDENPNVELPDFVITGTDISSIQKSKKIEHGFIPLLDDNFFMPSYSPDELQVRELSEPKLNLFGRIDSSEYFLGKISAKAGNINLPSTNLSLSSPFENGMFQLLLVGENKRAYIDNSEQYRINGGVNLFYQSQNESPILNGTKFQLHADYGRTSYKLFAANDPFIKRSLNKGNLSLRIENLLEENVNYLFGLNDEIHSLQDNVYSENLLSLNSMLRFIPSDFSFGINSNYVIQFLKNDIITKSTSDFLFIKPFVGYRLNNNLKFSLGINYFNSQNNDKIYPYLFVGYMINSRLSVFGEYSPEVIFETNGHAVDRNPYFYIQNFVNHVYEKKNSMHVSAKYEFETYYEINGGLKYYSSDSNPYFESSALAGRFNIKKTRVSSYSGYVNLLFHSGPYGYFYGTIELNETKMGNGNILPYHPVFVSYLTYGYKFDIGLNSELTLNYSSKQFTDILNKNYLNPFVDLSLDLSYTISKGFQLTLELNNLLNRKNYRWLNYQEPQLDLSAGLIYRW
ncbi:MAG: hypothetical protein HXY50_14395 [Ignavibacteriaceae bacterium]|nr:hypothetical protein [Ignavibacteriaceae bacterium]